MKLLLMTYIILLFATPGQAQNRAEFDGSWNEIVDDGHPDCLPVFAQSTYHSKHFLVGPTYRTIVTNFSHEVDGFFSGMNFVSNFGYNNDFLYNKTTTVNGIKYHIEIYGIINTSLVLMDAEVSAFDAEGIEICMTVAKFSGFN